MNSIICVLGGGGGEKIQSALYKRLAAMICQLEEGNLTSFLQEISKKNRLLKTVKYGSRANVST